MEHDTCCIISSRAFYKIRIPSLSDLQNTPTPNGYWYIISPEVNPGGFFGTRWLGLSIPFGAYGVCGTDNPDSIGKKTTHGCIYMMNSQIERLFPHIELDTPVVITGPAATGRMLEPNVCLAEISKEFKPFCRPCTFSLVS